MAFTYGFGANMPRDAVRMLIGDTDSTHPIMDDGEIDMALYVTSSMGLYASGQSFATGNQFASPTQVYSLWYAAAACLDSMAANKSYLSSVQSLLDVKLDASKAAQELRKTAQDYRDREDNAGHFAIAESVDTVFQARQRTWRQLLRIEGA